MLQYVTEKNWPAVMDLSISACVIGSPVAIQQDC